MRTIINHIYNNSVIPVLFKFPTRCHHPMKKALLSTFVHFVFVVDLLQLPDKNTLFSENFNSLNDWQDMHVGTIRWTHRYWPLSDVFLKEELLERSSLNVHQRAANSYSKSFLCGREEIKTEDDWLSKKSLKMFFRVAKPRSPFTKLTKELFSALLISSVWGLYWALFCKRLPAISSNKSDTYSLITSKKKMPPITWSLIKVKAMKNLFSYKVQNLKKTIRDTGLP